MPGLSWRRFGRSTNLGDCYRANALAVRLGRLRGRMLLRPLYVSQDPPKYEGVERRDRAAQGPRTQANDDRKDIRYPAPLKLQRIRKISFRVFPIVRPTS